MLMKLLPNINDVSALLIQQGRQFNFGIDDSKMVAKVTDGDRGRGKGYNGGQNSKGVGKSIVIKLGTQLIIIIGSMDFLQTSNKRSVVNCVEEEGPNDDNRSLA